MRVVVDLSHGNYPFSDEIINITEAASRVADENEGQLRFDDFVSIVEQQDNASEVPFEGPDPKVRVCGTPHTACSSAR